MRFIAPEAGVSLLKFGLIKVLGIKSVTRFFFASGICLLATPVFYSCGFDTGLETVRPLPLGSFKGKFDVAWPGEYHNPRIAVVWESLDGALSIWDVGSADIDATNSSFTGNFSGFPDNSITSDSSTFLYGKLWLYDDANEDGHFQLTLPLEYEEAKVKIFSARLDLQSTLRQLADASTIIDSSQQDSFLVEGANLYHVTGSSKQSIRNQDGSGPAWSPEALIQARNYVLFNPNKWEEFFNRDDHFETSGPQTAHGDTLVICHPARFWPHTPQFEDALQSATLKRAWLDSLAKVARQKIDPILTQTGAFSANEKIIGRSTGGNIVYFPNSASGEAVKSSEKASVFSFARKENLQVGFNLIDCDVQRNCEAKDWVSRPANGKRPLDVINVSLGELATPVFGTPNQTPNLSSLAPFQSATVSDSAKSKYDGTYTCACGAPLYTKNIASKFWMIFPRYGLMAFKTDSNGIFFYENENRTLSIEVAFTPVDSMQGVQQYKLLSVILDQRGGVSKSDSVRFYAFSKIGSYPTEVKDQWDSIQRNVGP